MANDRCKRARRQLLHAPQDVAKHPGVPSASEEASEKAPRPPVRRHRKKHDRSISTESFPQHVRRELTRKRLLTKSRNITEKKKDEFC